MSGQSNSAPITHIAASERLDRTPRFRRPDRPTHAYAQATRRALTERLQTNAARPDSHSGRAA